MGSRLFSAINKKNHVKRVGQIVRLPFDDLDISRQINLFPILYDLYDLAHVAGWDPYNLYDLLQHMFPGLDLYYTDLAQTLPMYDLVQHMFPGLDLYYTDVAQPLPTADEGTVLFWS